MVSRKEEDPSRPRGTRKDGKPYKDGNTREDGSYAVGKNRTPAGTRFGPGDGRRRGKRPKGTKNLMTEWREELDQKITVTEGGRSLKVTKQRALIKSKVSRGLGKSDRANEEALRYAELSEKRDPGLQTDDLELIETWLAGLERTGDSDDMDPLPGDGGGTGRSDGDGNG